MIINYIVRIFSRIFNLLIIPAVLCIIFDSSTGFITITAGTFIFVVVMFVTFGIANIIMSKDKEDDNTLKDIDYFLIPWKW